MKTYLLIVLTLILSPSVFAQCQNIYVPVEVQKSYKNETRSINGRPGKNYWQNRAVYDISARIDTTVGKLFGMELIKYYNKSPDTLNVIIIRLYQDIYKSGNPRDYDIPACDISSGTQITKLIIDKTEIKTIDNFDRLGSNLYIPIDNLLLPDSSITIDIEWNYSFATEFLIRGSGKQSASTYFCSYWYPQVAVYDDITGWDELEYKGLAEFYNDYSDYKVSISVPKEFIVWATGELQNPNSVLSKKYQDRYFEAISSGKKTTIIDTNDLQNRHVTFQNDYNTWSFFAKNVTDFAFGASREYIWEIADLIVDSTINHKVTLHTAYKPNANHFEKAIEYSKESIFYFSYEMPGITYPFPALTIFQGTSAMEYPMMVNIREYIERREWLFISTLIHEIAHSYFPFYVGTNERKYAFMDEGWAHMLPLEIQTKLISNVRKDFDAKIMNNIWNYEHVAGNENYDRPPIVLTTDANHMNYHIANHNRPWAAYYFLMDMLGTDLFIRTLNEYINRWKYKHPIPLDFFNTFNDIVGEDLSWFWKPWFYEFGYPDLAIDSVYGDHYKKIIKIKKAGNIPIPAKILVIYTDNSDTCLYKSAEIWMNENTFYEFIIKSEKEIKHVYLGDPIIPDVFKKNNEYSN